MFILIDGKPKMEIDNVDIQIGAVEIKNATTDDRALVSDASTARASTNHVISVQHLDATGKVQPAGELVGNGIFVKVSDGTTVPVVETTGTKKALNVNLTDGTNDMPTGDALARSLFVNVGDGTTTAVVETAGSKKALNVNVSDGTNDMPTMDAVARRGLVGLTDGTNDAAIDPVNTARTTASVSQVVQHVDATGKVLPAGDLVGNGIFVKVSDGTTVPVVETTGTKKALNVNITDGTNDQPTMDAVARRGFVGLTDGTNDGAIDPANTSRTTATVVQAIQHVDATGKVQPAGDLVGNGIFTRISDGTTVPVIETTGTKKALNVNLTDGTNDMPTMDAVGRAGFIELTDGTNVAAVDPVNTARTTATVAQVTQHVDVTGKVQPAGDAVGNEISTSISDGTTEVDVIATINSLKSDLSSVAGVVTNVNGGDRDTGTQTVTLADNDPAVTALQLIDNAVFVDDTEFVPATSSVMMIGAEFDDTTPDSVGEGDAGAVRMSGNRNMYTTIRDGEGNERGAYVTSSNNLQTDIAEQTLTAVKISATAAANTVSNPVFVAIGDGAQTADVETLEADIDTKNALTTNSLTYGMQVSGTTHPLLCTNAGVLRVDTENDAEVATTPALYNITMTDLDTQYSQALPAGTKKFEIRCQDPGFATRFAYVTGKVATPTAPYKILLAGEVKSIDNVNLAAQTLYFACSTAGKVFEIEAWT